MILLVRDLFLEEKESMASTAFIIFILQSPACPLVLPPESSCHHVSSSQGCCERFWLIHIFVLVKGIKSGHQFESGICTSYSKTSVILEP